MNRFAVIEVDSDYDYINGLEWVKSFATEEEAQKFIDDAREVRNNSYKIRTGFDPPDAIIFNTYLHIVEIKD